MSATADQPTRVGRSRRRNVVRSVARAVGLALLSVGFAFPAIATAYRSNAATHPSIAIGLLPVGVYLTIRLYPDRSLSAAIASLFVPVGSLWTVSGYAAYARSSGFPSIGEFGPSLVVTLAGLSLLLVGTAAAFESKHAANQKPHRRDRSSLVVAHLVSRIIGAFLIAMAVVLPLLATAYRHAEFEAAPISLGLLPAGAFLVTRRAPRQANAAVVATLLLPAGSVVFMFGAMAGADARSPGPNIGTIALGLVILAAAVTAAWSTWGSPLKRRMQIVARTLAVIVWGAAATLSVQAVAEEQTLNYIGVLGLEIDGADLFVEVPFQGGCARDHVTVNTELKGDVLEVLVTEPVDAFHCLAGCLAPERPVCTEVVHHRLDPPPPAGLTVVAASRPGTGLLRMPFVPLLGGLVVGAALWIGGRPNPGPRARSENPASR